MGNLRKKRRRKIAQHKRKKRSRSNRHKKRTWGSPPATAQVRRGFFVLKLDGAGRSAIPTVG